MSKLKAIVLMFDCHGHYFIPFYFHCHKNLEDCVIQRDSYTSKQTIAKEVKASKGSLGPAKLPILTMWDS